MDKCLAAYDGDGDVLNVAESTQCDEADSDKLDTQSAESHKAFVTDSDRTAGVIIQQVSSYSRYDRTSGVIIQLVSSYIRCDHTTGVIIEQVSSYSRCDHTAVIIVQQV